MKICDRTNVRDGTIKRATHTLDLGVRPGDDQVDLCLQEYDLVVDFIRNPNDWKHVSQIPDVIAPEPPKRKRGRPSNAELKARREEGLQSNH